MRIFIESLKRLFDNKKITESKLVTLCNNGTITDIEKNYILGKEEKQSCIPY